MAAAPHAERPARRDEGPPGEGLKCGRRARHRTPDPISLRRWAMPTYPDSDTDLRVDAAALLALVTAVFRSCDQRPEDAALVADSLVTADRRGVHSHGVLRVPEYVRKLTTDGVDPHGRPAVVRERGACLVVDGGNSMGQVGAAFAMGLAIARARDDGDRRRRRAGEQPLRGDGLLRHAGPPRGHDRPGHDQRPAHHGPLGRGGAPAGDQPAGRGRARRRGAAHRLRRRLQRHRPRQGARLPPEGAPAARRAGRWTPRGAPPPTRRPPSTACCSPSGASRAPPWRC